MGNRNLLAPERALALLLAAAAALPACQRQAQDASAIPHTPIPKAEARLSLQVEDGQLRYEGAVADPGTRDAISRALESAVPGSAGTLAVEPRTLPAAWIRPLGPAATALRQSGGRLAFAGKRIELGGRLTQEQRATLYRRIRTLYPGYELAGAFRGADLRYALPGEGDDAGLLEFLNARPIEFRAGTGMLTQAGMDGLARAARGLKAAGPSARVEIHVHPEPGADAAAQHAVAGQRADAILTQLALRGVAPARMRAMVAASGEPANGRIVEFAPFRPQAAAEEAAPPAATEADGRAESEPRPRRPAQSAGADTLPGPQQP